MLGHSGYLPVKRKALLYTLRTLKVDFTYEQIDEFMDVLTLSPFKDAIDGLNQLSEKFNLVILSNGEQHYLEYLAKNRIQMIFTLFCRPKQWDNLNLILRIQICM